MKTNEWIERIKQKDFEKKVLAKVRIEDLKKWANSEDYIDKENKKLRK
ncbi:MAG TPA: hypothetical protein P5150_03610 [Candidatus Ratteibacteria bacterium]|jgi:hypothetical protein|nr:hypothetical protein [Candidatus Ratteibacteria bacterium]